MTTRAATTGIILVAAVVGAGLWRQRDRGDTAASRTATPSERDSIAAAAPAGAPRDTIAAVPIQWSVGGALARLRQAGIEAAVRGDVRQPFLAVPGVVIGMKGAEIQVYLYGDAGAAGRDAARLDTNRVAPPAMMISWIAPPSLIWHNNMIAIVLTRDEALRDRITHALEPRQDVVDSP